MNDADLEKSMTPEQERSAAAHFLGKWKEDAGSAGSSAAEADAGLCAALDRADQEVRVAFTAQPSAEFAAKVLAALPARFESQAAPALTASGARTFAVTPARRFWPRVAAGVVAGLLVVLAGVFLWRSSSRREGPQQVHVEVKKGRLVGADGLPATTLEAGHTYRVEGGGDVVLKVGPEAVVRLLQDTRFEVPGPSATEALKLRDGSLYAAQAGEQVLRIEGPSFQTEIAGVSLVLQAEPRAGGDPFEEEGHGLVLVFKGSACVRPPLDTEPVVVGEGQMFFSGLGAQGVETFLAESKAEMAKPEPPPPAQRKLYAEAVRSYHQELKAFEIQMVSAKDSRRQAELADRHTRVKDLLEQHQRRLDGMPDSGPAWQRAKRVRRAWDEIERAREAYSDPTTWL
jgi:hypothetical protein